MDSFGFNICCGGGNCFRQYQGKVIQILQGLFTAVKNKFLTEVESSRTHFEVLGLRLEDQVLGLEASIPRKLACPRLEDSTIFWTVEISLENARNLAENLQRTFLFSSFGA